MPEFVTVAQTGDLEPGRVMVVELAEKRIALCNVDGKFYAIDDVCTHDGGSLDQGELMGDVIECPRHGAQFDVRTGKVVSMPAVIPVGTYLVKVEGQSVQVAVEA